MNEKYKELKDRLEEAIKLQQKNALEIFDIQRQLSELQKQLKSEPSVSSDINDTTEIVEEQQLVTAVITYKENDQSKPAPKVALYNKDRDSNKTSKSRDSSISLEKFIGENLINKIGILVLIVGIIIGVRYSIENNLMSPSMRIALGYAMGGVLLFFGLRLRSSYRNYSAVLVSGAIAIFYFITYFAFDRYGLMPQWLAFGVMLGITAFAVAAALSYDNQVIAIIGFVGAYAIPFLLASYNDSPVVLFTYILIINLGILIIASRKKWRPLLYSAFFFTWVILISWFKIDAHGSRDMAITLVFGGIFYLIFQVETLIHAIRYDDRIRAEDIILLLLNTVIYIVIGYEVLDNMGVTKGVKALFTIVLALLHFNAAFQVHQRQLKDQSIYYLIFSIGLALFTLAIPIGFSGAWITLIWSIEAVLLLYIGRRTKESHLEVWSYLVLILAMSSLVRNWGDLYYQYFSLELNITFTPIRNMSFLMSFIVSGIFGLYTYLYFSPKYRDESHKKKLMIPVMSYIVPAIFLLSLYMAFYLEIYIHYRTMFRNSTRLESKNIYNYYKGNRDILYFMRVNLINYSLLFVSVLSLLNVYKLKNRNLASVNILLNSLMMFFYLTVGLYSLSELRESYLLHKPDQLINAGRNYMYIRYVSYFFVALTLYASFQLSKQYFVSKSARVRYDFLLYISILWIATSELINWMDVLHFKSSYKLGVSVLWGIYSMLLVMIGISQHKQYLRVSGIVLFGITLIKVIFYDLRDLDTLSRTIIFIALGVLLLIVSFLYVKYKNLIDDDKEE